MIDRFNYDTKDDSRQTLIVSETNNLINNPLIVGNAAQNGIPFLYRGVGLVELIENEEVFKIII